MLPAHTHKKHSGSPFPPARAVDGVCMLSAQDGANELGRGVVAKEFNRFAERKLGQERGSKGRIPLLAGQFPDLGKIDGLFHGLTPGRGCLKLPEQLFPGQGKDMVPA